MKLIIEDFTRYPFRDIAWHYFDGGDNYPVIHQATDWRRLPFMVLVCPTRGEYFCEVEGEGVTSLHPGESLLVPADFRHKVAMPAGGLVHHAHIQFSIMHTVDVLEYFTVPRKADGRAGKAIAQSVRRLAVMLAKNQSLRFGDFRLGLQANETAHRLLNQVAEVSQVKSSSLENFERLSRIRPVLAYMEDHIDRVLTRDALAAMTNLSPTRFHYVFEAATGCSPMAYMRKLRLSRAQLMLLNSGLSISQIAKAVGFPDIYHFSKAFKTELAESPSKYRQRVSASLR